MWCQIFIIKLLILQPECQLVVKMNLAVRMAADLVYQSPGNVTMTKTVMTEVTKRTATQQHVNTKNRANTLNYNIPRRYILVQKYFSLPATNYEANSLVGQ